MSKYAIPLSFHYIIQFVHDKNLPTKDQIIAHLRDKEQNISSRTFERYLRRIRDDLGMEITYHHQTKGYFIDIENSVQVGSFFKFLEIVQVADIFSKSLKNSNTILDYVSFDDSQMFKGIENLKDLLIAIKGNKKITFTYKNFERDTVTNYAITPLLLKEYLNRWYVIGAYTNNEIRTFGIDRMFKIEIKEVSKLTRAHFEERLKKFKHTVGLTYHNGEPEEVTLLVDDMHVNYLRSLPLHSSQIILPKNDENKHEVKYVVYPNFEFKSQILKMGTQVKVLTPQYLKEEIKIILAKTLESYD